ncbi:band 7 protein AGAP004871-like [Musca domestica]|uniref:Band 7 protein AGAP004871-like n=1 Tax=Musca domestica TaxID=7370 RepID=A0ABM3UY97_MUSDO|nr:band 7 protein AGAP004871-like [Musca domestica]
MRNFSESKKNFTNVFFFIADTTPIPSENAIVFLSYILLYLTFPLSIWFCLQSVAHFQRIVIFRLGRLRKGGGVRGPGLVFLLPCVDDYIKVDLRTQSFDVPPQEVLTRDSVTIQVDAVVYYSVRNPLDAVIQIRNVHESTKLLAQTTLRNVVGTKNLMELLTAKESMSRTIGMILDEATDPWGVKVERVEIKQIQLPRGMQRAMATEREAEREAQAKIVAANGELEASHNLREASDVMRGNPMALQLRYLQTLNTISNEYNHTIIFPFPVDALKRILGKYRTVALEDYKGLLSIYMKLKITQGITKNIYGENPADYESRAKKKKTCVLVF